MSIDSVMLAPRSSAARDIGPRVRLLGTELFVEPRRRSLDDSPPEHPLAMASRVISRFRLPHPIETLDFAEKGNINQHTFLIRAGLGDAAGEWLLQRINPRVFVRPRSVMEAMMACLEAQTAGLAAGLADGEWEPITLVPTRDGRPFHEQDDRRGLGYWRLMRKIGDARTYKSLSEIDQLDERLRIAREAGRGLAIWGDLTATMPVEQLANPLPGYRETRVYLAQLESVRAGSRTPEGAARWLPTDPILLESTGPHFLVHLDEERRRERLEDPGLQRFLALIDEHRDLALTLLDAIADGLIRRTAIHGDTKLDNFLFSTTTGRVKSLVDLDTILPHTWLADWGDMVRSLSNVAGEKEPDPAKVQVDLDVYEALAAGFLATATAVTEAELDLMIPAVQILALELGIRFLTDYLRGDSYFKLGPADPPDLNRTRAIVQLTLFERLRAAEAETAARLAPLRARRGAADA